MINDERNAINWQVERPYRRMLGQLMRLSDGKLTRVINYQRSLDSIPLHCPFITPFHSNSFQMT